MRLDELRLYHIHPQNLHYIGFAFVDFDLDTVPLVGNDDSHETADPPPIRPEPTPPPAVRGLDDLSVRRAERAFLKS